jgi:hypothetical protein
MESVTDNTRCCSINSNISWAIPVSARMSPRSTFQSRNSFTSAFGWHDANGYLRRLAEVRTIECNRRNRPAPQPLPGFLAQALEESIFHDICSLSDGSVHDRCRSRAPYSISSSARASNIGDLSRPNVLAVLRFTTVSNLVGACTGRSPGFSPLRMRST